MRTEPLSDQQVLLAAAGGSVAMLVPVHVAISTTHVSTFVMALSIGTVLSAFVGASLIRDPRRTGAIVGLVTAVLFVLVALVTAGVLCLALGHTAGILVVGPPAVLLTVGAVVRCHHTGTLWTENLGSALGAVVLVVLLGGAVSGFFLVDQRGVTVAKEAIGARLEAAGLAPYSPEFEDYRRDDVDSVEYDGDGYWLPYTSKDSPETSLSVLAKPLPDEPCPSETCTTEDGFWLTTSDESRTVMVRRGQTLMSVTLSDEHEEDPAAIARALRSAPTTSWYDVLFVESDRL